MQDFTLKIEATSGAADQTLEAGDSFLNNIYLSLMIDRGSFFQDEEFGSRLYLLKREKSLEKNRRLAKDYCEEALEWMIESGKALSFDITTEIEKLSGTDRLNILGLATKANGQTVEFSTFKEIV